MMANKMRAWLSSLGIIIWVFSVVALLALWQWATNAIIWQFSSLGTNLLTINPGAKTSGDVRKTELDKTDIFTLEYLDILKKLDHVVEVSAITSGRKQVIYSNKNSNVTIQAVTQSYEEVNNVTLTQGRFFTQEDELRRNKVAVIWPTVVDNLFGLEDPIGKTILIQNSLFRVVGVTKERWGWPAGWSDNVIIIPLTTAQISLLGSDYLWSISVKVDDKENMESVEKVIEKVLLARMSITDTEKAPFTLSNQADILQTVDTITWLLKTFLWWVAAISLIVWGIWVMNILLVTVSERTKEIGIRKAIGARSSDIIKQFLIESVILTVAWGIIGILLAYWLVVLIVTFMDSFAPAIASSHILLALSFSIGTGLFFGIYPAYKAAKLKPIDALRSE